MVCRYVMHVAADYRLWSRDRDEIRRNNVVGTQTVMDAAWRAGVERVVYTSSVAALALSDGRRAIRRRGRRHWRKVAAAIVGAYKRSKVAAQSSWSRP